MSASHVLGRLERVRVTGPDAWAAACPAHEDRVTSLSVGIGHEGRVLLNCHAGCSVHAITAALELALSDLFDRPPEVPEVRPPGLVRFRVRSPGSSPSVSRPVRQSVTESHVASWAERLLETPALLGRVFELKGWSPATLTAMQVGFDGRRLTLPVRDRSGELRGVLRYRPGTSSRSASQSLEPKMLASAGTPRSLFPAPELFAPVGSLWLVEGEPDAVSACELGLMAVGLPGVGSWARHRDEWVPRLAGRRIVVLMDCDLPGRETAELIDQDLRGHADVRVLTLDGTREDGHDLGDELAVAAQAGELAVRRLRRWLEERGAVGAWRHVHEHERAT